MGDTIFPVALEGLMVEHWSFMNLSVRGSTTQECAEDAKWNNNDKKGPWSQATLKRASTTATPKLKTNKQQNPQLR